MANQRDQEVGVEISLPGRPVRPTAGVGAARRLRRTLHRIGLRLVRGRAGLLMLLCGCLLTVAGVSWRRWVGRYRLPADLLEDYCPLHLPDELFLSWWAYRIIMLISMGLVLTGAICCLVGVVKAVRGRSTWPSSRKSFARGSRRVRARVIRSARSREPAGGHLVASTGELEHTDSNA